MKTVKQNRLEQVRILKRRERLSKTEHQRAKFRTENLTYSRRYPIDHNRRISQSNSYSLPVTVNEFQHIMQNVSDGVISNNFHIFSGRPESNEKSITYNHLDEKRNDTITASYNNMINHTDSRVESEIDNALRIDTSTHHDDPFQYNTNKLNTFKALADSTTCCPRVRPNELQARFGSLPLSRETVENYRIIMTVPISFAFSPLNHGTAYHHLANVSQIPATVDCINIIDEYEEDPHLNSYNTSINQFAQYSCEICLKMCYKFQISTSKAMSRSYLPQSLSGKCSISVCNRCNSHLNSSKTTAPSRAFWNSLDPGQIPEVLARLSQAEQRLLARMIPFVKIIKFQGRFGQYGFKGQSILFACDIFEVTEQLPRMLPRSPSNAGIVFVTEELENLNIIREFQVRRAFVYEALQWLIDNNELYKDVVIDRNVDLATQPMVRIYEPPPNPKAIDPESENDFYKKINASSKILRGSWNYTDHDAFGHEFSGFQSLPIALAHIIKSTIVSPKLWSVCDLDFNMLAGDKLYLYIRESIRDRNLPAPNNSHLKMSDIAHFRNEIFMFGLHFSLIFEIVPDFVGFLQDSRNKKEPYVQLKVAMTKIFERFQAAVMCVEHHFVGIMYEADKYFFTDPRSCGPKGSKARSTSGKACVICCDSISELERICKRAFGVKSSSFIIHIVNVQNFDPTAKNNTSVKAQLREVPNQSLNPPFFKGQQTSSDKHIMNSISNNQTCDAFEYLGINHETRIIRATSHQGNQAIFTSGFAGVQCCAMALACLVRAHILPINNWSTNILDDTMQVGDSLYYYTHNLSTTSKFPLSPDGFLQIRNFDVIKDSLKLFHRDFTITYADDTDLFGTLTTSSNDNSLGRPLLDSMSLLFTNHQSGIIINRGYAYGLMLQNDRYYLFDSHSCDIRGLTTNENGRACLIQCDSLSALCNLCIRKFGVSDSIYNLHSIDIHEQSRIQCPNGNVTSQRSFIEHNEMDVTAQPSNQNSFECRPSNPRSKHSQCKINCNFRNSTSDDIRENLRSIIPNTSYVPIHTSLVHFNDVDQPDVEDVLDISENGNKIVRKTKDSLVNADHEARAEEFAWYHMFPYGKNGLNESSRSVPITPLDYFQTRILCGDSRFTRNDYLFYALSTYEYKRIKQNIAACGKKIQGPNGMVDDVHLYLQNLRGSATYWTRALYELLATIRILGEPHFFATFSCNDLNWLDMRKALLIADGRCHVDPSTIDLIETQRLIEQYPVTLSRHFMVHVHALIKRLRNDPSIFKSEFVDFWWRVEFQNRGSPHLHMVIWLKDYPEFDTDEGIRMLDNVITCALPPETSALYHLVTKCQIHKHTGTCKKNNTPCRFHFPREECPETRIVAHSSEEFLRTGGRICMLKRRKTERWINNYNKKLLIMWQGNMDIQPCGSNEAIAYYICKYLVKGEPTALNPAIAEAITTIRREESDISRKLFKVCMKILQQRQVSASECAFRLCHLPLRCSSRKSIFLNTRKPNERFRMLKFDSNNEAIGLCCNIFDRYEKRPINHPVYEFENMCLLEYAMNFEPIYEKQIEPEGESVDDFGEYESSGKKEIIRLLNGQKMTKRSRPAVVRVPNFRISENAENHYYSLLLQYTPFRIEAELLDGFESAKDAFLAREEYLTTMNNFMKQYRKRDQQLENAFDQIHAFEILQNPIDLPSEEHEEDVPDHNMDEATFAQGMRALNMGQRSFIVHVTESVQRQMSGSSERIKIFLTGNAGTGKTVTLNLLEEQLRRRYKKKVVKKCALTGAATKLTKGHTIHSLFKLPVQRDGKLVQLPILTGIYLRQMRLDWREIEFIFIDEISMVPYEMLVMIDSRLRQLKNCDDFFGGLNVILFGDLLQLKPVTGHQVFDQPKNMILSSHLWRMFTLIELTENMRQQHHRPFVEMLNALRVGALRAEHFNLLMDRANVSHEGEFAIDKALRIYPTNNQVFMHNNKVVNTFRANGTEMFTIIAHDILIDATRNIRGLSIADITPTDINKTGGLPQKIEIFLGAKIMLRSNIDVAKGLVNGSIGFITEIVWPYFRRGQVDPHDIPSVRVDFGRDGTHLICPKSIQFPAKFSFGTMERRMLPMILSWASTVHKMQGSTVDYAVVYLGPKLFAEGQAYVALSRVRNLDGLAIEELDCSKLTGRKPCNNDALDEMDRLRNI